MASLSTLPVELKRHCAQHFDIASLKAVRVASRATCSVATEYLFHTVILRCSLESLERLAKILGNDAFKPMVKRIIIDTDYWIDELYWDQRIDKTLATAWDSTIPMIAQFPAVREVEFWPAFESDKYSVYDYNKDYDYRTSCQHLLFNTLEMTPQVDDLSVKLLQETRVLETGTKEAWNEVRGKLRKLALLIKIDNEILISDEVGDPVTFADELFPHWLEPIQLQLTHLSLYCTNYWGVSPFADFRRVHFPNLKSLAMGNWTVAHDWQVDWITSHGDTLGELILDDCPIVFKLHMDAEIADINWPEMRAINGWDEDDYTDKKISMRWSDVFAILQERLGNLKRFGMGHGPWHDYMFDHRYELPARIEPIRYIKYWDGWNEGSWVNEIDGNENDSRKLENEHNVLVEVGKEGHKNNTSGTDDKDEEALNQFLTSIGFTEAEIQRNKMMQWDSKHGWCVKT